MKKIPYGISDFKRLSEENFYYIDKTKYIEELEKMPPYVFFIRPRRFGKSLFLSMLDYYYDINYKNSFKEIFKDTYIVSSPTKEANSYHILRFDFSAIDSENPRESMNDYCNLELKSFVKNYNLELQLDNNNFISNLNKIISHFKDTNKKIYLILDEYDNFINKILISNQNEYEKYITDKEAIFKTFFTVLKVGTGAKNAPIRKMFITGVSPMALFDVTSGYNIGSNISTKASVNNMIGLNQDELLEMVEYYNLADKVDLPLMANWYNNYLFSEESDETIYNTDMILYYLNSFLLDDKAPDELIDINVRSDYSKLRFLIYTNNKLNGNFNTLQKLLVNNKVPVSKINDNFSALQLTQADNFKSLMYFLGLATIESDGLDMFLKLPNETIKRIVGDYIQESLKIENIFKIDVDEFALELKEFAKSGNISVFHYLADEIKNSTSLRDYINGEHFVKAMFLTYLNLSNFYMAISEPEMNKGFADICLEPLHPQVKYIGLLEFKYIKKVDFTQTLLEKKIKEATKQLEQYRQDKRLDIYNNKIIKSIIIVYKGYEMVYCEEITKI